MADCTMAENDAYPIVLCRTVDQKRQTQVHARRHHVFPCGM